MTEAENDPSDAAERQRLQRLVSLYDVSLGTMAHGLCMYDADGRVLLYNQAFLDQHNLSAADFRNGMSMREVFVYAASRLSLTEEQLATAWNRRIEKLAEKQPFTNHHSLPNGRTIAVKFCPMTEGGWVAVYEDVTAQKNMEREARLQFERMQQAFDSMSNGLSMFGPDERLIICNDLYLTLYDMNPEIVKPGVSHRAVLEHFMDRGNHPGMSIDEFYNARMSTLQRGNSNTMRLLRRDGRIIEATSRPTPDGGWVTAHEDVTERSRHDEALREQHRRFDAALNNMSHGLAMFDAEHRLIVSNEKYRTIFGLDASVAKPGATLREIYGDGIRRGLYVNRTVEEMVEQRLAGLAEGRPTYDRQLADGRKVAITICPMLDGGWVGTYQDVTEARRLESERVAALNALQEQNARFDAALNNMSQGLAMFDSEHRLIVCNDKYLSIFRGDASVVKPGASMREIFEHGVESGLYPGVTIDELLARRRAAFAQHEPKTYDQPLGDGRTVEVSICPMPNGGWIATYEEVTETRQREAERAAALINLREQHRRFDAALNNMSHGLIMLDEDLRVIVCNQRYLEIFGMSPSVVRPGVTLYELVKYATELGNYPNESADERYNAYVRGLLSGAGTFDSHLAGGAVIQISRRTMPHGGWIITYEDITERHRAEERIAHMARHDALTELPNRVLFREKMAEGLARVAEGREGLAVLCLDLDNFKVVNDTLGHPVGDRLLTSVAQRLEELVGANGTIARLGGDEFAVLQGGDQPQAAQMLARRIVNALKQPVMIDDHEIDSGTSIGIAVAPTDGLEADHLIKCADLALYRAKAEGRGRFRFFEPDMDTRLREKRALELDLRHALSSGQFELHYQPQIRARDCELTGMEALLRWNHSVRGRVPPAEFIPIAEETGLIVQLGEWVLRHACEEAARWPGDIRVAVNLSPVQFKHRGLVTTVASALASAGLAASRLELEITEAVLLRDDDMTLSMLHQLRALGVRISMDDFGTGYSSLSYLRSFPFDKIKIDRSFIADLGGGDDGAAIVRAVAGLGASLGIDTTAEGVETAEQFERVRRDGCTEIQGYFFSPPRPASEIFGLVAGWRRLRAVA